MVILLLIKLGKTFTLENRLIEVICLTVCPVQHIETRANEFHVVNTYYSGAEINFFLSQDLKV